MPSDYFPLDGEGDPVKVRTDAAEKSLMRGKRHAHRAKLHPYEIRPIKFKRNAIEDKPVLGKELIPKLYPGNVALLAKTFSGKTTVENHLMEHCVDERTAVYIICATVHLDPSWKKIIKDLRARGVGVTTFTSLVNPVTGVNVLRSLFAEFDAKEKEEEKQQKQRKSIYEVVNQPKFLAAPNYIADPDLVGPSESKRLEDYPDVAPKRWIFLDDLSCRELRAKTVDDTVKKARHFKCRICVSTQHIIHLEPSAVTQLSLVCMWKGFSPNYMAKLHDRLAMQSVIGFKEFWTLYSMVTKPDHSFLTYYVRENEFRVGFSDTPIPLEQIFPNPDLGDIHAD